MERMRQYLEIEADEGSNDEEHDECAPKKINPDEDDENEDGHDADLAGFVVANEEVNGEVDAGMN